MKREWSKLNRQQLGTYAEYYAKMMFASYGWAVFTSEVDDHGIDFIANPPKSNDYYEIQVKSIYKSNYIFISKEKMSYYPEKEPLPDKRLICVLKFIDFNEPKIYLIPAPEWKKPNALLKDKDYEGKKSKPEWGINWSKSTEPIIEKYNFENFMNQF